MVKRNINIANLKGNYLFPEINRHVQNLLETNPSADIISLGVGDVTEQLPRFIADSLKKFSEGLGTIKGFSGYGTCQGMPELRNGIASNLYNNNIDTDDVFLSDGAKCDLGRLQLLFGPNKKVAIQDPAYPVYVDASIISGNNIIYMPCTPENDFFPNLELLPDDVDLIYFCSPNNPTGAAATKEQLQKLVDIAHQKHAIIIFDSAYSAFIKDPTLPRSIFEIEGAKNVAIEIGSFSKFAGFTGVRLGWTIVPKTLKFEDGTSVHNDWLRLISTVFNGASNISQHGGLACLKKEGRSMLQEQVNFYMENASILKRNLENLDLKVYGGNNAPYLWVDFKGFDSWKIFENILHKAHIVTTPGSGFGPSGEGFIRISAFNHRDKIEESTTRLISSDVIAPKRKTLHTAS